VAALGEGVCLLHDPDGQQVHRAPAPMGGAGAATPAIEMTARDEVQSCPGAQSAPASLLHVWKRMERTMRRGLDAFWQRPFDAPGGLEQDAPGGAAKLLAWLGQRAALRSGIDPIPRADLVSSGVRTLAWNGQTGRQDDASNDANAAQLASKFPIHGACRRSRRGTRTPDPIITSVSGDLPGTPWAVFIGLSAAVRDTSRLARHPGGRHMDATSRPSPELFSEGAAKSARCGARFWEVIGERSGSGSVSPHAREVAGSSPAAPIQGNPATCAVGSRRSPPRCSEVDVDHTVALRRSGSDEKRPCVVPHRPGPRSRLALRTLSIRQSSWNGERRWHGPARGRHGVRRGQPARPCRLACADQGPGRQGAHPRDPPARVDVGARERLHRPSKRRRSSSGTTCTSTTRTSGCSSP
jgi:hypothetical protein